MALNCKPGDLAVVIKSPFPENVGRYVVVQRESQVFDGDFCWAITCATPLLGYFSPGGELGGSRDSYMPDAWLRPIRDPGVSAVDEMVQRVGAPREAATC